VIRNYFSLDVILSMVNNFPDAAMEKDGSGKTTVHLPATKIENDQCGLYNTGAMPRSREDEGRRFLCTSPSKRGLLFL
jgi:hypothetical protein